MQDFTIKTLSTNQLPDSLTRLHNPPPKLYLKGNFDLLQSNLPKVGIVGARKFTPYGRQVTADLSSALARAGVVVVSGLALGVDSIAHKACLDSNGQTIAVLPCGIDTIYPSSHYQLAKTILAKNSLLVSEYEGKTSPKKYNFIERNRIIASLCDILIVTEAAEASGSLHTASFALEQGITVMAVPGNITSPYSQGTNKLIQNGAYPVLKPQDVTDLLGLKGHINTLTYSYLPKNPREKLIIDSLSGCQLTTNDLIKQTKIEPIELQTTLTLMEIEGVVEVDNALWRLKL